MGKRTTQPDLILSNGKPAAVILGIKEYEELLERAEDAVDLKTLRDMKKKPLRFRKLDDVLKGRVAAVYEVVLERRAERDRRVCDPRSAVSKARDRDSTLVASQPSRFPPPRPGLGGSQGSSSRGSAPLHSWLHPSVPTGAGSRPLERSETRRC